MDSSTRRRLILNFASQGAGKLSSTIVQLVQVPVFLHYWGVPLFGEWMIINAIPSYLAFSNIGFGAVAGNEMSMLTAKNDQNAALNVFQSCWWLIAILCSLVFLLVAAAISFIPVSRLLHLSAISETDSRWIVLYLGAAVLFSQLEELLQSAYRCVGRNAYGSSLKSIFSLAAFTGMILAVLLGAGARTAAMVYAAGNIVGTLVLCSLVRHDVPWIRYGWSHADFSTIRRLAAPAVAFMGFPIGNALNLQGTLMVVGYALGPTDVVIFGTARTVSRIALQLVQMVNATFWPELTRAYGAKDETLLRTLHRGACQMALIIAVVVVTGMMVFGPWFLTHWTGGHVPPSRGLLAILLLVVILYALWSTSSTLVAAINQHQKLALYYILGTGVTILFTYFLARRYGLYGAAASLLISELVMNTYVLPTSLRVSRDTLPAFLESMWHVPPSLHPHALLRRINRFRPRFGS